LVHPAVELAEEKLMAATVVRSRHSALTQLLPALIYRF
jgi:hypothetical protein